MLLKQDEFVSVLIDGKMHHAKVKGLATTQMPVIGHMVIVEIIDGSLPNETYPFNHVAIPECHIQQ